MRIVLVHPNYHSGGAEIAGNWPPAWVAYLAGHLKDAGFTDIHFIDAMTNDLSDEDLAARLKELKPDVVGSTAITPSIYKAERVLEIAKEVLPDALRVLGGIHATFMYKQVLSEAPWVDVIVRGEGEEIFVELIRTVAEGRWPEAPALLSRASPTSPTTARSSPPRQPPRSRISTAINPDWTLWNGASTSTCRSASASPSPTWRAAARSPAPSARSGNSGATTACAIPKRWSTRSRTWSTSTTGRLLHPRRRGTHHQPQEVHPVLRGADRPRPARQGASGASTPASPTSCATKELLPFYRKAGLVHISLGTEAAAQLKLDRFNKETKVERTSGHPPAARGRHLHRGAVHRRPRQRDRRDAGRNLPHGLGLAARSRQLGDVHALAVHDAVQELGDKVEIFDFEKYNFVTPIMKPEAMDRANCSTG
jgi:anaerobic magnesium-protoporphyrin IX monomethyl ester cyclase